MPFTSPFPSRRLPSSPTNSIGIWYRRTLPKHPFLLFGLPFITTMVAGSFFLTPATAIRYEQHDRRVKTLNREEELRFLKGGNDMGKEGAGGEGAGRVRRRVGGTTTVAEEYARLAGLEARGERDLDKWEQKRVKRFKGEVDGRV